MGCCRTSLLTLLALLLLAKLSTALDCPPPYAIEAGKCIYTRRNDIYTWCQANEICQSMDGELINQYESLKVLDNMPSAVSAGCRLWYGVSDLADERDTLKGGWQRINDYGNVPYNTSLWYMGMPSSLGNQDCISSSTATVQFIDTECSNLRGFMCEYVAPKSTVPAFKLAVWKRTHFKRTSYNYDANYCFKDVEVDSVIECAAAATSEGSTRRALFNTMTKKCRLLQFTDAQVDEWIETGANWVKFSV